MDVTGSGSDPLAERLRRLDTCAVSDALDALGMSGVVTGLRPMWPCGNICGRAVTVKLGPAGVGVRSARHLGTAAVEAAAEGDVIVVEHRGRRDAAGWGGLLSAAAGMKRIAGVIVDGACRDIDESRDIGFPVFAMAAVPCTARNRVVEQSFNEPVVIERVRVSPGDLAIADGSGIAFIPADRAEEVIARAESIAAREAAMTKAVLAGTPVAKVMGTDYETMLERK